MDIRQLAPSLSRREFTLAAKQAHLILLEAGALQILRSGQDLEGAQMVWVPPEHGEVLRLEAGSRALILAMTRLELAAIDGLGVAGNLMTPLDQQVLHTGLSPEKWRRMALLCELIADELATPREDSHHRVEAAGSLILTGLLRQIRPQTRKGKAELPLSDRFMFLVAQHAHEHWTVNAYAHALGVTRFQLGDAVQQHLGMSPQAYLQSQWSTQAMALLRQPQIRITAIAYRLGFQDPAYFSRAFKALTGQTPRQWRQSRLTPSGHTFAAWP